MTRAQDGDRTAYEALLVEAAVLIREFLRRRLDDAHARDDIVQDTLLAIHRYRHTFDPKRPFCPWMYAIARHRLIDYASKQRRRSEHEILGDAFGEPAASSEQVSLGFLDRALALLSQKQREIVRLLKLEALSVAEVSSLTGMSESNVKVTAHRGYKNLRNLIASRDREE
jgi:RNA polymerase sigma factor (sigma-70 family)